jgi:hypothetical protein
MPLHSGIREILVSPKTVFALQCRSFTASRRRSGAVAGMAGSDLKVVACHLCFGAKRDGFGVSDPSPSPRATNGLALDSCTHPTSRNPSKVAGRTQTIRNLVRRNLSYKPSPAAQAGAAWSVLSGSPFAVMNHATSCTLLVPVLRKACI